MSGKRLLSNHDTVGARMEDYGMSRSSTKCWLAIMHGEPYDDAIVGGSDVAIDEQTPRDFSLSPGLPGHKQ